MKQMRDEILEVSSKCSVYLSYAPISLLTNWVWQISNRNPSAAIRFVRGHKMKTTQGLFDEFSAAMQLPYYFGENWDAFRDCLLDLKWLSAEAYGVIVSNSQSLLEVSPRDLEILLEYLEEAATEFKQEGKRFFTLFQYEGENKAKMCETLESAGVFSLEIDIK